MPFTDVGLETAKSSLTFEIIEEEKTVGDVSEQSLLSYYRDVTQTYNKWVKYKSENARLSSTCPGQVSCKKAIVLNLFLFSILYL